jgi:hypothetical protein
METIGAKKWPVASQERKPSAMWSKVGSTDRAGNFVAQVKMSNVCLR